MSVRVRLDLGYDGTDFSGWARQPDLRTVQGELTRALGVVLRSPDDAGPQVTVAGRTDAGVHARGQVVHVDIPDEAYAALPGRSDRAPTEALVTRLRGVLPGDIVVARARVAPDEFDARFSALERRYEYRIADSLPSLDPLRVRDTVYWRSPLELGRLNAASGRLLGLHDFAAFCKKREGATTIRTLLEFGWERDDSGVLIATIRADAFCHSMVRALVGSVVPVGEGKREVDWPEHLLTRGDRTAPLHVMPAHGLCLQEVVYPEAEQLAVRAQQTRARRPDLTS